MPQAWDSHRQLKMSQGLEPTVAIVVMMTMMMMMMMMMVMMLDADDDLLTVCVS